MLSRIVLQAESTLLVRRAHSLSNTIEISTLQSGLNLEY